MKLWTSNIEKFC